MNAVRKPVLGVALLALLSVSAPVAAQTADDVTYKVLLDDLDADKRAALPAIQKLIEMLTKVKACTPDNVPNIDVSFFKTCTPVKGDPNAASKMDACVASEKARIQASLDALAKAQSDTSWWTRVTSCSGLSDAWTAFKASVASFFSSTRSFVSETRACLIDIGKLLLLQPTEISDATLRAKFSSEMGILDKIRTTLRTLSSPTATLTECQRAVQAAKKAYEDGKKVVAAAKEVVKKTGEAAKEVVKAAEKVVVDKAKEVVAAATDAACSLFWKAATAVAKGLPTALKELGPKAVAAAEKLGKVAPGSLEEKIAAGVDAVGFLKTGRIVLKGTELGALVCSFYGPWGQVVTAVMKKLSDPMVVFDAFSLILREQSDRSLVAALTFRVTLSEAKATSSSDAVTLAVAADITLKPDLECIAKNPMLTISTKFRDIKLGAVPTWLSSGILNNVVVPSLCLKASLPAAPKAAGVTLPVNACSVLNTCLTSRCAAPVVNSVLRQVFPIKTPFRSVFAAAMKATGLSVDKTALGEIDKWVFTIDDVKASTQKGTPGAGLSASVSMGPPSELFTMAAQGTAKVRTRCGKSGGTLEVVPTFELDMAAFPDWLSKRVLPAAINPTVGSALSAEQKDMYFYKKVEEGKFLYPWPYVVTASGVKENRNSRGTPSFVAALQDGEWQSDAIKFYLTSQWLTLWAKSVLKGAFAGDINACKASQAAPALKGDPCAEDDAEAGASTSKTTKTKKSTQSSKKR